MKTFNVVDVETANPDCASICQIGIVHVSEGKIVDEWETLVNPEDDFDEFNISIHGINAEMTENSPTLPQIRDELRKRLKGSILISHTNFDRNAFKRAMERYELEQLDVQWLDSASIARRAWVKYSKKGYGLKNLANDFNISFRHHDALEDARVAAEIVLKACSDTGTNISDWFEKLKRPKARLGGQFITPIDLENNEIYGNLSDHYVAFTGKLSRVRKDFIELVQNNGGQFSSSVTSKTSVLVVGGWNSSNLNGHINSSKYRKAKELSAKGSDIQIVSENAFMNLLD